MTGYGGMTEMIILMAVRMRTKFMAEMVMIH